MRFLGGDCVLDPEFVACDASVVAVSEERGCVVVLSWRDGGFLHSIGSPFPRHMTPRGLRLLPNGCGIVVADAWFNRVCVYSVDGTLQRHARASGAFLPWDVEVIDDDGDGTGRDPSLLAVDMRECCVALFGAGDPVVVPYRDWCGSEDASLRPCALAVLRGGGGVDRDRDGPARAAVTGVVVRSKAGGVQVRVLPRVYQGVCLRVHATPTASVAPRLLAVIASVCYPVTAVFVCRVAVGCTVVLPRAVALYTPGHVHTVVSCVFARHPRRV